VVVVGGATVVVLGCRRVVTTVGAWGCLNIGRLDRFQIC
jgi:hypothetical protein